jgi:hypothetical protein
MTTTHEQRFAAIKLEFVNITPALIGRSLGFDTVTDVQFSRSGLTAKIFITKSDGSRSWFTQKTNARIGVRKLS